MILSNRSRPDDPLGVTNHGLARPIRRLGDDEVARRAALRDKVDHVLAELDELLTPAQAAAASSAARVRAASPATMAASAASTTASA